MPKNTTTVPEESLRDGDALERKFVHQVYDQIAEHFGHTRYKPWPRVAAFLQSLPVASLVLDVGCGNGKYLKCAPHIFVVGCDRSKALLDLSTSGGGGPPSTSEIPDPPGDEVERPESHGGCGRCAPSSPGSGNFRKSRQNDPRPNELFASDCLDLGVKPKSFDACICVAVIHHLSSDVKRRKAVRRLIEACRVGGQILVYLWSAAHESGSIGAREFKSSDVFVPWTRTVPKVSEERAADSGNEGGDEADDEVGALETLQRYYHVFTEAEARRLCVEDTADCTELVDFYFDSNNWAAILRRVS